MSIGHIKLNGISTPIGYQPGPMLLSWLVEDAAGTKPTHTHIRVWADDILQLERLGDLDWQGTLLDINLLPRQRYRVQIDVTDDSGALHTGESWFETGMLGEAWQAKWIGPDRVPDYSPILSRQFSCTGAIASARLFITGLGLYTAQLNGQRISDEVLTPGIWDYEAEVQYQTYDVTRLLSADNRLDITLGNGWYKGRFGLEQAKPFGKEYAALAELHICYADGQAQHLYTDEFWHWLESDIPSTDGIYDGETLDRLAHSDKENPLQPVAIKEISLSVVDRISLPVREMEVLPVQTVLHTPAGETVLDFGQNHTGWLRFKAALPPGTEVSFEFGEVLQQGNFYNANYRSAVGGFRYRSNGRKETVCQQFTFYGFRYVKVTGWLGELRAEDFESPVLCSDLERTGWLETGHANLNRLYQNVLWGQKSNFLSIPTDCPQRDERLGWTGDAQVFAPTACYNMDTRAFFRSFLQFLRSEQQRHGGAVPTYVPSMGDFTACALWSDAAALIPNTLQRFYGSSAADEFYPMMKDWVDYVAAHNPGSLYTEGFQFGDWLAQDGITPQSFKGGTDDIFLASAYWMNSAQITAQLARRLGKTEEAEHYTTMAGQIRSSVMETYFTPAGRLSVDTQAAYVTALHLGLWTDKAALLEQFRRRLRYDNFQIRCGFAGAPLMCKVLSEHGMEELACDLLLRRGFPGWMYAVELGATTVWERWNSLLPDGTCSGTGMNSLNHYAYGSVMEYVYGHLAGLRPSSDGFQTAVIAPLPDIRLGHLNCICRTTAGEYRVFWRICPDGQIELELTIPFGCTAYVTLPRSPQPPLTLCAGNYTYRYQPEQDYRTLYHMDTRLGQLAEDARAQDILGQHLPQLLSILKENNLEFTTQTFRELSHAFYLGLNPENIAALVSQLSGLSAMR